MPPGGTGHQREDRRERRWPARRDHGQEGWEGSRLRKGKEDLLQNTLQNIL